MISTVGLAMTCALLLQTPTPALEPAVQRQVDGALGDRHLDAAARVSESFEAAPIKDVLAAIGRSTGLAVRFDQAVPESERPFTGQLADLSLDAALARVLTANAMAFTVTGAKSVFVYSDTAANRRRFTETIRAFALTKAGSAELLQGLVQHMRTSSPDGIGPRFSAVRTPSLIFVRATADKMDEIAKFIAANDK